MLDPCFLGDHTLIDVCIGWTLESVTVLLCFFYTPKGEVCPNTGLFMTTESMLLRLIKVVIFYFIGKFYELPYKIKSTTCRMHMTLKRRMSLK
jgi:hypothetical protein